MLGAFIKFGLKRRGFKLKEGEKALQLDTFYKSVKLHFGGIRTTMAHFKQLYLSPIFLLIPDLIGVNTNIQILAGIVNHA